MSNITYYYQRTVTRDEFDNTPHWKKNYVFSSCQAPTDIGKYGVASVEGHIHKAEHVRLIAISIPDPRAESGVTFLFIAGAF